MNQKSELNKKIKKVKNKWKNCEITWKMKAEKLGTHLKGRSLKKTVFKFVFNELSSSVARVLAEKGQNNI